MSQFKLSPKTSRPSTSLYNLSTPSTTFKDIDCTPSTKSQLRSLKRESKSFKRTRSEQGRAIFQVEAGRCLTELIIKETERQALKDADSSFEDGVSRDDLITAILNAEKALLAEQTVLLLNQMIIKQDLNDTTLGNHQALADAYVNELRVSFFASSGDKKKQKQKQKLPGL
ncbi:MAG: hypothetical protein Q9219_004427 [cf. Caloplaca sp. 3 TL-2023]